MNILFLCTGNSCRSQMAEGWGKTLHPDHSFCSAGIETHGLNPHAVAVMREVGVDISGHESKLLSSIDLAELDLVVTVCGHADETCPILPGNVQKVHWPFPDPPKMAARFRDPEQKLDQYRQVRDQIGEKLKDLDDLLGGNATREGGQS